VNAESRQRELYQRQGVLVILRARVQQRGISMNILIKSSELLPEIVIDFAYGRIKRFINKDLNKSENKIIKRHGYAFIIHKAKDGINCTVKKH
jgi:hypothetical protein